MRCEVCVDMDVTYHRVLDAEVNTLLVGVDTNLDRIVNAPGMRQGRS